MLMYLCRFFFIFLSLILEQVRAHDRKEIQSIWLFWAHLIGSGVLHTEQNQELSFENKNGYAKQNEQ